jgi:hypothetical protein
MSARRFRTTAADDYAQLQKEGMVPGARTQQSFRFNNLKIRGSHRRSVTFYPIARSTPTAVRCSENKLFPLSLGQDAQKFAGSPCDIGTRIFVTVFFHPVLNRLCVNVG